MWMLVIQSDTFNENVWWNETIQRCRENIQCGHKINNNTYSFGDTPLLHVKVLLLCASSKEKAKMICVSNITRPETGSSKGCMASV